MQRCLIGAAYGAVVVIFLWLCAQFYLPGKGFTYLIQFGGKESARYLPDLRAINHFEYEDSFGYDAQWYAQIAMHPQLRDPALASAVDNLPYRARRILFCWTAYILALGNPARALYIFAVQNIFCWLVLAGVLLRWFPPDRWGNLLRWTGVLFSAGLCLSVRGALLDGPSLLLIAIGIALAEQRRPVWSAVVLGISGLGRETNILAGAALAPRGLRDFSGWTKYIGRMAMVVFPLVAWFAYLHFTVGSGGVAGLRNFDWPLAGYIDKWRETIARLGAEGGSSVASWSVLMLIALTAQALFFLLRPRWSDPWWRVGAVYTLLMLVLGGAVWEDYPGAASRVLLPMTLAFNILVPRGRRWWALLLLGNLTLVFSTDTLKPPGNISFETIGPRPLIIAESGEAVEARFDPAEWFMAERSRLEFWRWSRGSAAVAFHNPHPFAIIADIHFDLKSNDRRDVTLSTGGKKIWSGPADRVRRGTTIRQVRLEPGDTIWRFETDRPAEAPNHEDPRKVTFSIRNLQIRLKRRADPIP